MNWIQFTNQLPKPSSLILVRYSCGGVCLTMFKGTSYKDDDTIEYKFNENGYVFQKVSMRGFEKGVPTHWCEVNGPEGYVITEQPLDIID